jgi:hypothetical protein
MTLAVVMFVIGVVLFLAGLIGSIKIQETIIGPLKRQERWLLGSLGIVFMIGGFVINRPPQSGDGVPNAIRSPIQTSAQTPVSQATTEKPEALIDIIKKEQHGAVKESFGETASQCFTEQDLAEFIRNRVPEKIVLKLERDPAFLNLVIAIKELSAPKRTALLETAATTRKQTWAEIGHIDKAGQTDAGKDAELRIARAIVDSVEKLVPLSVVEIRKKGM